MRKVVVKSNAEAGTGIAPLGKTKASTLAEAVCSVKSEKILRDHGTERGSSIFADPAAAGPDPCQRRVESGVHSCASAALLKRLATIQRRPGVLVYRQRTRQQLTVAGLVTRPMNGLTVGIGWTDNLVTPSNVAEFISFSGKKRSLC